MIHVQIVMRGLRPGDTEIQIDTQTSYGEPDEAGLKYAVDAAVSQALAAIKVQG